MKETPNVKFEVQLEQLKICSIAQDQFVQKLFDAQQRMSWVGSKLDINYLGCGCDIACIEMELHREVRYAMQLKDELKQIKSLYERTEERILYSD